ncbi:carbohydrate kinase [Coprinellus micaceus]|uniref:gluconokinase n=1 Tax=Coprinellus micaceus TaxID=71717 RepID=A0A4Y7SCM6_COPMI|nr:carbohydrate kinase [Coprinellus micaceus]
MGVSGTGKSTLGTALSQSLSLPYIEGDDLHPPANIAKMSNGTPLDDGDREPWLRLIRRRVEESVAGQIQGKDGEERLKGVIVGCSSLKRYYRDILRGLPAPPKPGNGEAAHTPPPESLRGASPGTLAAAVSSSASSSPPCRASPNPTTPSIPKIKTFFAFISGPPSLLYARMEARPGHFMKASMLDSQLAVLEDPTTTGEEGVIRVSIEDATEVQVEKVREGVRGSGVGLIRTEREAEAYPRS